MPSSRTGSNGREMHQAAAVNVKLLVVCGSDRTSQAESAKKDSLAGRSVARKGSSSQTGVVITSPRANAKTNPAPSSSCCIHCQVYPCSLHTVQPAGHFCFVGVSPAPGGPSSRLTHVIRDPCVCRRAWMGVDVASLCLIAEIVAR